MTPEQTLEQWLQDEARVRATHRTPGTASPEDIASRSGLEFYRDMLAGVIAPAPMGQVMGFALVHAERGRIVFQGTPRFDFYNPIGSVHGGWYCTLLDSATGCAVHSMLPRGKGYTTLEIKVNLIRRLTDQVGPVRAEGTVIHVGAATGIAESRLYDVHGKVYAHATSTCMVMDLAR